MGASRSAEQHFYELVPRLLIWSPPFCKGYLSIASRVVADLYSDSIAELSPPAPMDFAAEVLIYSTDSRSK